MKVQLEMTSEPWQQLLKYSLINVSLSVSLYNGQTGSLFLNYYADTLLSTDTKVLKKNNETVNQFYAGKTN